MFKCKLYSTDNGMVSFDEDMIGEVLIDQNSEGYVEAFSGKKIRSFVKADGENLFFPQPSDHEVIMKEIDKYKFSVYIREDLEDRVQKDVEMDYEFYNNNPTKYVFNKIVHDMHEVDTYEKAKILMKEKIHTDIEEEVNS